MTNKTDPPNFATHFFKSLDSPRVRTVRKTHLRNNRPRTEKTLSVSAKMRDRRRPPYLWTDP